MPATFLGYIISSSTNNHANQACYVLLTDEEMETQRLSAFYKANQINETFGFKLKLLISLFFPPC